MKLKERLAAAVKRLTGRSAPSGKAASLLHGREGAAAMPKGTAGQPPSGTPSGKRAAKSSVGAAPRADRAAAPKTSGGTAPKAVSAALPQGSAQGVVTGGAAMPPGTAKRPVSSSPAVPKGTGESSPARLQAAGIRGSAQAVSAASRGRMPASSWQSLPQAGAAGRRETGGAGFSSLAQETALTGPPPDPARQLSELLRVQRRMNPGAGSFGEEVL